MAVDVYRVSCAMILTLLLARKPHGDQDTCDVFLELRGAKLIRRLDCESGSAFVGVQFFDEPEGRRASLSNERVEIGGEEELVDLTERFAIHEDYVPGEGGGKDGQEGLVAYLKDGSAPGKHADFLCLILVRIYEGGSLAEEGNDLLVWPVEDSKGLQAHCNLTGVEGSSRVRDCRLDKEAEEFIVLKSRGSKTIEDVRNGLMT
mmetsp:Transcript_19690/g.45004  ORF Transcript_19690/g.45004 Transcript_19690/m.45004 type:complete len:204 (-) Transcript_19690:1813-2424(-)